MKSCAEILDRCERPERLGVCLDTCHVHDAGYDLVNDLDGVLTEFDRVIGLSDSAHCTSTTARIPAAQYADRHEVIGGGYIGLEALRRVVWHPALTGLPMVLETPNELSGYAAEIRLCAKM